jgi:two-component system, chemotaxis family, chemotaxis protein CheY
VCRPALPEPGRSHTLALAHMGGGVRTVPQPLPAALWSDLPHWCPSARHRTLPAAAGEIGRAVLRVLKRVLIVEDDACIREALAECVASMGVEVATARDGEDGLMSLRSAARPDAILLDLSMPRLDGHGFLSALRDDPVVATIPVVAMTAFNEGPRLPVYAFLKKPFDLDELAKILGRLASTASAA